MLEVKKYKLLFFNYRENTKEVAIEVKLNDIYMDHENLFNSRATSMDEVIWALGLVPFCILNMANQETVKRIVEVVTGTIIDKDTIKLFVDIKTDQALYPSSEEVK
jgi:hypothetical protein